MIINLDLFMKSSEGYTESDVIADNFLCCVRWFCRKKSYGFVSTDYTVNNELCYTNLTDGSEISAPAEYFNKLKEAEIVSGPVNSELFLHISKVFNFRDEKNINPGDILITKVVKSSRGMQIADVHQYFSAEKNMSNVIVCDASIKWFNEKGDFGFIKADLPNFKQDIFFSGKKMRETGINPTDLMPKRKVICSFVLDNGRAIVMKMALK